MTIPKIYVDGILVNYGDDLFPAPYRSPKRPPAPLRFWGTFPDVGFAAKSLRSQIQAVVRRSPEVMVKITSKKDAGKGLGMIGKHLDYISRNGKVEMEDGEGNVYQGKQAINDFKDSWGDIPDESHRREAFNVVFSMPKGTPAHAVKDAVRDFTHEEFEGYDYLFALHTDTDQPHVHVCIKAKPLQRGMKRLNPKKADLQRWRTGFAEQLKCNGIDANATPRKVRGLTKERVSAETYYVSKKLAKSQGVEHRQILKFNTPVNALKPIHSFEIQAWSHIAKGLSQSADTEDRKTAIDIVDFMNAMPIIQSGRLNKTAGEKINQPKSENSIASPQVRWSLKT